MKFNGPHHSTALDSILGWGGGSGGGGGGGGVQEQYSELKLTPTASTSPVAKPSSTMNSLDNLLLSDTSNSFAELKPLTPMDYGSSLLGCDPTMTQLNANGTSTNGGRGNGLMEPQYKSCGNMAPTGNGNSTYYTTSDMVVSSTVNGLLNGNASLVKEEPHTTEYILPNEIDIAAIIGDAIDTIADTTVPNINVEQLEPNDLRDTWADLDAWLASASAQVPHTKDPMDTNTLPSQFVNQSPPMGSVTTSTHGTTNNNGNINNGSGVTSSTLHTLLTQGPPGGSNHYNHSHQNNNHHQHPLHNGHTTLVKREPAPAYPAISMLQSRLQNGGLHHKAETTTYDLDSSDPYLLKQPESSFEVQCVGGGSGIPKDSLPHSTHMNPPGLVSTSQNPDLCNGGRFRKQPSFLRPGSSLKDSDNNGEVGFRLKNPKSRLNKGGGKLGGPYADGTKEKPVHRCGICNRGFLNKSNIKVHLRTHTGEKPFKCETCGKAFRQKAHLLKHMQIHKRVTRE